MGTRLQARLRTSVGEFEYTRQWHFRLKRRSKLDSLLFVVVVGKSLDW